MGDDQMFKNMQTLLEAIVIIEEQIDWTSICLSFIESINEEDVSYFSKYEEDLLELRLDEVLAELNKGGE